MFEVNHEIPHSTNRHSSQKGTRQNVVLNSIKKTRATKEMDNMLEIPGKR
jgi:hypothetical protein